MSTHIEHGTRVRVKSIRELNALVLDFRRQVEAIAQEAYQRKCAELVYQILDEAVLQPTDEAFFNAVRSEYASQPIDDPQPFLETDLRWIVRHIITDHYVTIARTQERDPDYDWGCYLSAIPHRTGLYVLLYAESDTYHQIWRSIPGVEDYAYWNHTDPPEGMSQARWDRRRDRWNALLGHPGIPSRVGMTISVYDPVTDWENRFWEVKPEFIPDYERRIQHWAFTRAVEEVWHTKSPEERGFNTVFRTQQWIKTEAGAARWDALKHILRQTLPSTWEDALVHQPLAAIWTVAEPFRAKLAAL